MSACCNARSCAGPEQRIAGSRNPTGSGPHLKPLFGVNIVPRTLKGTVQVGIARACLAARMQNENIERPGVILAVEDEPEDVEILRLALAQRGVPWKVVSVQFAKDAIRYLGRVGEYADENRFPYPSIIVLDLALPGMSGMDFLTWARGEKAMPPIVILSYSALEENRSLSLKLGAKGYFLKSPDLKETAAMIETLLSLNASGTRSDAGRP